MYGIFRNLLFSILKDRRSKATEGQQSCQECFQAVDKKKLHPKRKRHFSRKNDAIQLAQPIT